ncbi:MAG TPA: pseudouridine synthase [Methanothrix sp.]|nr:pseudouridine synthase [Methanothrix sp.]
MSEREMSHRSSLRRVVVKDAVVPFVARGGRVFSRQIVDSDPGVENGELVMVVDKRNNYLSEVQIYFTP